MATDVLEVFNIIASALQVPTLTKEQICETLQEEVRQQVSRREIEARAAALGTFGTGPTFVRALLHFLLYCQHMSVLR